MKNFAKKFNSDPAEKEKFFNFMHMREEELKKQSTVIAEKLNPFYMSLIKDFAKQEGYKLEDSPEVQEKCKEICRKIANDFQNNLISNFHNMLN